MHLTEKWGWHSQAHPVVSGDLATPPPLFLGHLIPTSLGQEVKHKTGIQRAFEKILPNCRVIMVSAKCKLALSVPDQGPWVSIFEVWHLPRQVRMFWLSLAQGLGWGVRGGERGFCGFLALASRAAPPLLCLSRLLWLAACGLKVIPPWVGVLGQVSLFQGGGQMAVMCGVCSSARHLLSRAHTGSQKFRAHTGT